MSLLKFPATVMRTAPESQLQPVLRMLWLYFAIISVKDFVIVVLIMISMFKINKGISRLK